MSIESPELKKTPPPQELKKEEAPKIEEKKIDTPKAEIKESASAGGKETPKEIIQARELKLKKKNELWAIYKAQKLPEKNYKKPLVELLDIENDNDLSIINYKEIPSDNSINLPEPIKISLNSTLDIIEQINQVLHSIHDKIVNYKKSYIKYVSRINVHNELQQIKTLDIIFDKRLKMLLDLLVIYDIKKN